MHKAQGSKKSDDQNTPDATDSLDYGKAGAIAEEVLSAINTVTSFGGQNRFVEWYVHICIITYILNLQWILSTLRISFVTHKLIIGCYTEMWPLTD